MAAYCRVWLTSPAGWLPRTGISSGTYARYSSMGCLYPLLIDDSLPSVLWRCWLGGRKGIQPVKNWVVGCWHGYLFGARCRLAYGPADATATVRLQWQSVSDYLLRECCSRVDSSGKTASSSASWSRFGPPSNFVNGHVSTVWFMVCRWPQSQEGDWARPHLC